jgi:hypothetical protein
MSKVMQSDPAEASTPRSIFKCLTHVLRLERRAVRPSEHEVGLTADAVDKALLELPNPVTRK